MLTIYKCHGRLGQGAITGPHRHYWATQGHIQVGADVARSRKKNRLSQSGRRAGRAQLTQRTLQFVHKCCNVTHTQPLPASGQAAD